MKYFSKYLLWIVFLFASFLVVFINITNKAHSTDVSILKEITLDAVNDNTFNINTINISLGVITILMEHISEQDSILRSNNINPPDYTDIGIAMDSLDARLYKIRQENVK